MKILKGAQMLFEKPIILLKAMLGTNPICVAAPANDGDSFVLDMATTSVAFGKVRLILFYNRQFPHLTACRMLNISISV